MNRKPTTLLVSLVLSIAGCMVLAVLAAGSTHGSSVTIQGIGGNDAPTYTAYGEVTSASKNCLANRTVRVYFRALQGAPFKQVDTAKTSLNGAWAASGNFATPPDAAKAVMLKSKFGRRHHEICAADQDVFIYDK